MNNQKIGFAPTLHPTKEEFSDFAAYMERIETQYSHQYGALKIVPPEGYLARKKGYDIQNGEIGQIQLKGPIEQNSYGKGGVFELLLIQKKSIIILDYYKKVNNLDKIIEKKQIEEVEKIFWKNIGFSPPIYGADVLGSIMDKDVGWNLTKLNTILNDGLNNLKVSGVNDPYLYVGSYKSMFGWHIEDLDLCSINFLHEGKPKFWYALPQHESGRMETFAKSLFSDGFSKCDQFLRHKTTVINPYLIKQKVPGISISKVIQKPGEFVITFSQAYHSGFNWGFNIAEAVNFANPSWLPLFQIAKSCKCVKDNVLIDKKEFAANLQKSHYKNRAEVKQFLQVINNKEKPISQLQNKLNKLKNLSNKQISNKLQMKIPKLDEKKKATSTVKSIKMHTRSKSQQPELIQQKELDIWAQCDSCNKWRKLSKQYAKLAKLPKFFCSNINNLTCRSAEASDIQEYQTIIKKTKI